VQVPQSLTVSQGYYFGYPQRSERSEALQLFESWLKSAASGVGGR
jgi:LysR family glycine cleavage system transcriptional activator